VWIVKTAGHDFSDVEKYGEITIILEENISPFNLDRAGELIQNAFLSADENDYIVPVGPPVLNMLMMRYWPFNTVRFLLFHARTKNYVYREIEWKIYKKE